MSAIILYAALFAGPAAAELLSADGRLAAEAPAGWSARPPRASAVLFDIRGPAGASLVASRVPGGPNAYNRAALAGALGDMVRRADARGGVGLRIGPRLRAISTPNGAEADYVVATARGRYSMAVAYCRFGEERLVLQAVGPRPVEALQELVASLRVPSDPAPPLAPGPGSGLPLAYVLWGTAASACLAAYLRLGPLAPRR